MFVTAVCFTLRDATVFLSPSPPDGSVTEPDMSASFCPDHKAPMVLFLDRVYGIEDQSFLLHLLEVGFLPDLRAATSLDTVGRADSDCREVRFPDPFYRPTFSLMTLCYVRVLFFSLVD